MTEKIVSRDEWMILRQELLIREKAHTQERASLAEARRNLPWVKVEKVYQFTGEEGTVSLADLFQGQSQLLIYHIMFGEDWDRVCSGCERWADSMCTTTHHFKLADARLVAVSRGSYASLAREKDRRKWNFDWYSVANSDFNIDYYASTKDLAQESRVFGSETLFYDRGENHGINVFARNDAGEVFHTFSCFNRGIEDTNGAMGYFDLLPKGRPF